MNMHYQGKWRFIKLRFIRKCSFISLFITWFIFAFCEIAFSVIVSYPAPPGLVTSTDFVVSANGKPVWVERIGSKLPSFSYTLYSSREMEDLNVVNFSCSGSVTIKITASANIDSYLIRPKSRNIKARVSGRDLIFKM